MHYTQCGISLTFILKKEAGGWGETRCVTHQIKYLENKYLVENLKTELLDNIC